MFVERIERELGVSFNQVERAWESRDCWEIESRKPPNYSRRFGRDRYQKLTTPLLKLRLLKSEINGENTMAFDSQLIQKRIRIRIPKHYHQEPVISRLVSHYNLTVNITAAVLGANANGDGWFDLDLQGTNAEIESAMTYLNELDLEIWYNALSSIF